MPPVISIDNLSKAFGKYRIISSLSLQIEAGCVYGLVGLNGAGKTTLLRLMLGILKPDGGSIAIKGFTPWLHDPRYYRQCGVVLENDGFWGNLTSRENCRIYASAKGLPERELAGYLAAYWQSTDIFTDNKKVRNFSRGQRMQCALCRAFMGSPAVFFLDEPALALDMNAYRHFKRLVSDAKSRGAALIISSHQLDTIDELCDRVGILRDGAVSEINRTDSTMNWFIDTADAAQCGEIITQSGGMAVRYDGGWHFTLSEAHIRIPEIIRALVRAGLDIREVRQEESGFGTAIRTLYTATDGGSRK